MAGPTGTQQTLLIAIEARATDLNRLLDLMHAGLVNARDARNDRLIEWLDREIDYTIRQLAEVHAQRDALRRELQGTER